MALGAIARILLSGGAAVGKYVLKKYGKKKAASTAKSKLKPIKEVKLTKSKSLKKIKPVKSATKVKEVQTRPKKSLQNQKPDKSSKSSDWDAAMYKQPRGHGKPMGPRAARDLEKKHPKAAMNKRIKAGTISNQPRHIKNEQFIGPLPKAHRTARLKKVAAKKKGKK